MFKDIFLYLEKIAVKECPVLIQSSNLALSKALLYWQEESY